MGDRSIVIKYCLLGGGGGCFFFFYLPPLPLFLLIPFAQGSCWLLVPVRHGLMYLVAEKFFWCLPYLL
jgi:hypothetical protein